MTWELGILAKEYLSLLLSNHWRKAENLINKNEAKEVKEFNEILHLVRFQYELREGKRRKMEQERREREERERKEREEQERQEQLERIRRQEEEEIRRREEEEARRRREEREAEERAKQQEEAVVSAEAEAVSTCSFLMSFLSVSCHSKLLFIAWWSKLKSYSLEMFPGNNSY